jgi:predicted RNA-binding protein with EMAP domain
MDNITIAVVIEAIIFLIPLGTLLVKLGKYIKRTDTLEEQIQEFKIAHKDFQNKIQNQLMDLGDKHEEDVRQLMAENKTTVQLLNKMNEKIAEIATTLNLMVKGKIKTND